MKKLVSSAGYTLMELLAALAIAGILMTLVVAGVGAGFRVYRQSTALSEAQVLSSTLFQALSDELRFATDIVVSPAGHRLESFTSATRGILCTVTDEGGRLKIGGTDLVSEQTYTGLDAWVEITYTGGTFWVTLTVTDPAQENVECARAEFAVAPLNG